MPRHCFIATELHGPPRPLDDTLLVSDLPILMAMYEPGMRMESISALTETDDEYLIGLRMRLTDKQNDEKLDLVMVGPDDDIWSTQRYEFGKYIDRVSIVSD